MRNARPLGSEWARRIAEHAPALVPIALVALVAVLLVPLPPLLLDVLIAANLALSAVILLTTFQARSPLEFSVFPSLLLAVTLYRLVLNVASTRLILTADAEDAEQVAGAAGQLIESFGQFVAGGSIVVGFVLFLILIVVQFVVITKGASRVSEVAARFTLDSMPGKQMAIDADLNAGLITEPEARLRREQVAREGDFYGAMDGASKFVRGDAIAGLLITAVNILGGFAVGVFGRGWPVGQTLGSFTRLTIGDGLAAQVPAFLTALAAGLIVTRSASRADLGREMAGQLTAQPAALAMAAGLIASLALLGLPPIPMLAVAVAVGFVAYLRWSRASVPPPGLSGSEAAGDHSNLSDTQAAEPLLTLDALELEIGYGLVRLADARQGGDLLERIALLRRQTAQELGLVIPSVRVRDNMTLPPQTYRIYLRGNPVAQGSVPPGPAAADAADRIVLRLAEVVHRHSADLLTRQHVEQLLGQLRETAPRLVEEVVGPQIKPAELRKVLQNLLRERVPIRDLETIIETLGDVSGDTRNAEALTEQVRGALRRTICNQYVEVDAGTSRRRLYCATLAPQAQELIAGSIDRATAGTTMLLPGGPAQRIIDSALAELRKLTEAGHHPVLLAPPLVRLAVRRLLELHLPQVAVLAYGEVDESVQLESIGLIGLEPVASIPSAHGGRLQGALV